MELLIWPLGLLALYFMDPAHSGPGLCVLKRAGVWCPGCGLGHSVHHLLHGHWRASVEAHWLGPFAVAVLLGRIWQLGRQQLYLFRYHKN